MLHVVLAIVLVALAGCSSGTYRPSDPSICSKHDPQCEVVTPRTPSPIPW